MVSYGNERPMEDRSRSAGPDQADAADDQLGEDELDEVAAGLGPANWFPRWICLYCPQVFRSEDALERHMRDAHQHHGRLS